MAFQNPEFVSPTHRWRPQAQAPSREVPSQIRIFLGQKQSFLAKVRPDFGQTAERREMGGAVHMWLDFPMSKSPSVPSNSTICARNASKKPHKAPKSAQIGRGHPQTRSTPYLGLCGSNPHCEGTEPTRNPPLLVVSTKQKCPNGCWDPGAHEAVARYGARAQTSAPKWVNGVHLGGGGGMVGFGFKNDPRLHGMLKQLTGGEKSGGALPKLRFRYPKTAFFGPKRPRNPFKSDKRRGTIAT